MAASLGDAETVNALLNAGANVNAQNKNGRTALMQAAIYRHIKVIKILLDRGANIGVKDINGMTALICAAWYCEAETINILIDAGSSQV